MGNEFRTVIAANVIWFTFVLYNLFKKNELRALLPIFLTDLHAGFLDVFFH